MRDSRVEIFCEKRENQLDCLEVESDIGGDSKLIRVTIGQCVVLVTFRNSFQWSDILNNSQIIVDHHQEKEGFNHHMLYKNKSLIIRAFSNRHMLHDLNLIKETLLTGTFDDDEVSRKCVATTLNFEFPTPLLGKRFVSFFPQDSLEESEELYLITIPWCWLMKISDTLPNNFLMKQCSMTEESINTEYDGMDYLEQISCMFVVAKKEGGIILKMSRADISLVKETSLAVIKMMLTTSVLQNT